MKNFSIRDLERLSGIKAHTLRTWEKRYGVPSPKRDKRVRSYSLPDVKEILDFALLTKYGFRISAVSKLEPQRRAQKLNEMGDEDAQQQRAVHNLIVCMYEMGVEGFEEILDKAFRWWPADVVVEKVIGPFLTATDLLWQGRRLAEEHLAVPVVRRKLQWAINNLTTRNFYGQQTAVLFLPDVKQLDLGLLLMHFRLLAQGVRVIYLGNDVTAANLKAVFEKQKPDLFYTYFSRRSHAQLNELLTCFEESLSDATAVITVYPEAEQTLPARQNIKWLGYEDSLHFLTGALAEAVV